MLRGTQVGLRARVAADIPALHAELYEDVVTRSRNSSRPWYPVAADSPVSPFSIREPDDRVAGFSVIELADGGLVGDTTLWEIDTHNRSASIGLALRPAYRGRGLGTDVVRTMCYYGFSILGLHRLAIETLGDNAAMIRSATKAGFTLEGTSRAAWWVDGQFLDGVLFGLLAADWKPIARAA